jgi:hypothetical protein
MSGVLANMVDDLGQIVVKALAVAGGAAVGALVTGAVVGFVIRRLFRKPQPPALRTFFRVLGAFLGGLAVGVLLFTGVGGGGWFGGGGSGHGDSASARVTPSQADKTTVAAPTTPAVPTQQTVRVVMLGGDLVRNGAAYRLDGERQARTLAEVKEVVQKRMAADPPARTLDILVFQNSVAGGSAPVEDLAGWARQAGLTVTVVTAAGDIPP